MRANLLESFKGIGLN